MKRSLALLAAVVCLLAAPPEPKKPGMDAERLALIPVRLKSFVDQGTLPGAVTLVARHGVVARLDAVGYRNLEEKKPMRTDSIFQIMSMTKPVTAVGIMMLMEEGRLALSDPVEKYLPEFRPLKSTWRPITIRDLLTHTSGVNTPEMIRNIMSTLDLTLAEAVSYYAQAPLEFEPGTEWKYSNAGIAVLGRIIEVVAGQPYERFIGERILRPLGMKNSFFFPPADKINRIALVYTLENGKLRRAGSETLGGAPDQYRKGAKYPCPECGLFSTAADVLAFHQMMLDGGTYNGRRLLSRQSVNVMTALHTGDLKAGFTPGLGWGLGWTVVREPLGTLELRSIGTFGHGGAFGTEGWVDPKQDLIQILMMGRTAGSTPEERNSFFTLSASAVVD
ncbi:MAG: serine hydrolase domain-containing protein [Bryobacteraceae bacterium]|jgi:CubicO group peptidase (beta-lactamase class C family)